MTTVRSKKPNPSKIVTINTINLEHETDELRHEKLPADVCRLIMQGRQSKGLSQKELACKISEKPQVIQDYESGRCIPNNTILGKIERIIGIKLRGKERGMAIKPLSKK